MSKLLAAEISDFVLEWAKEHDKERRSDTFIQTKGVPLVSGWTTVETKKHNIPKEYC